MLGTRVQNWRARPLRSRLADFGLAAAIALVAIAVIVNVPGTIHDTKRSRLDTKVMKAYLKAHPEFGSFGLPLTQVHGKVDYACAFRHGAGTEMCIAIDSHTIKSQKVLARWDCVESPKPLTAPYPGPYQHYCPVRRGKTI